MAIVIATCLKLQFFIKGLLKIYPCLVGKAEYHK